MAASLLHPARDYVNSHFSDSDAVSIILTTMFSILTIFLLNKLFHLLSKHGALGTLQLIFVSTLKRLPGGQGLINAELNKTRQDLERQLKPPLSLHAEYRELPPKPISRQIIREELLFQLAQEKSVRGQRGHGGIYINVAHKYDRLVQPSSALRSAIDCELSLKEEAYLYFSHSNTLYPFLFPGTRKFDVELIAMTSKLLHAHEAAGNITSGGTESIFMALKCWRSYGESVRGISKNAGNIVLCDTAHPAFVKSCELMGIEARFVGHFDDVNDPAMFGKMDISAAAKMMDRHTLCVVASAPCFPYSVVDDISGICAIAKTVNGRNARDRIPVHVDNCLGGFLLSFLGDNVEAFDFRVDGVWSMSCDMHKQAGSDKGCSAVLYDRFEYRRHQFYAFVDWPGGLYCSPSLAGSSNGGLKAVAWASLLSKGRETLARDARVMFEGINALAESIRAEVSECRVLGVPMACGVAFKFSGALSDYDYAVGEALNEVGGWEINRLQFPSALFFQGGHQWMDQAPQLVIDLKKAAEMVRKNAQKYNKAGMAGVYGTAASFPDRSLVRETCYAYLDVIHSPWAK